MLGLRRGLAGSWSIFVDVLFGDLQKMGERPLGHLNRGNLDVALRANACDLDPLGFALQAIEVEKVARFAAHFDGNGCRFVVRGPVAAFLLILAANLLELRFDGVAVSGTVAGRQRVIRAESLLGGVFLYCEEAFHGEVGEAISSHRSSQSVVIIARPDTWPIVLTALRSTHSPGSRCYSCRTGTPRTDCPSSRA